MSIKARIDAFGISMFITTLFLMASTICFFRGHLTLGPIFMIVGFCVALVALRLPMAKPDGMDPGSHNMRIDIG